MILYVNFDPREAIRLGTQGGLAAIVLSVDRLGQLTQDERHLLASLQHIDNREIPTEARCLSAPDPSLPFWRVRERYRGCTPTLPRPTFEALHDWLRAVSAHEERAGKLITAERLFIADHAPELADAYVRERLSEEELYLKIRDHVFSDLQSLPRMERIVPSDFDCDVSVSEISTLVIEDPPLHQAALTALSFVGAHAPEGARIVTRLVRATARGEQIERYGAKVEIDWHGRPLTRVYELPSPSRGEEAA